jgi:hypothetical protein
MHHRDRGDRRGATHAGRITAIGQKLASGIAIRDAEPVTELRARQRDGAQLVACCDPGRTQELDHELRLVEGCASLVDIGAPGACLHPEDRDDIDLVMNIGVDAVRIIAECCRQALEIRVFRPGRARLALRLVVGRPCCRGRHLEARSDLNLRQCTGRQRRKCRKSHKTDDGCGQALREAAEDLDHGSITMGGSGTDAANTKAQTTRW